jgi:hypothetical protein
MKPDLRPRLTVPETVPIRSLRSTSSDLRKALSSRGLNVQAAGLSFCAFGESASASDFGEIRKWFWAVYLQVRGEVAERLKAAVS